MASRCIIFSETEHEHQISPLFSLLLLYLGIYVSLRVTTAATLCKVCLLLQHGRAIALGECQYG